MEDNIITITNDNKEDIQYELVTTLFDEKTNTKYIVYKDIIDDEQEDVDFYVSKVFIENDKEIIEEITDDNEWNRVYKQLDKLFKEIENKKD